MRLPTPRGCVSAAVIERLGGKASSLPVTPVPGGEETLYALVGPPAMVDPASVAGQWADGVLADRQSGRSSLRT